MYVIQNSIDQPSIILSEYVKLTLNSAENKNQTHVKERRQVITLPTKVNSIGKCNGWHYYQRQIISIYLE